MGGEIMRKIEEKADEYISSVINESMGSAVNAAYDGFIAGYKEAMRIVQVAKENENKK